MRRSHPNLFFAMVTRGAVGIVNGSALIFTKPRMPPWMPHNWIGGLFIACGLVATVSAVVHSTANPQMVHAGKIAFCGMLAASVAMAVGLLDGFGQPDAVTASLDRPIMYLAFALALYPPIKEPSRNPLTATTTDPD